MKRKIIATVAAILLLTCFFVTPVMALPDIIMWESYTTGNDSNYEVYGNTWLSQTFTTGTDAHTVSQISLAMYREGEPGYIAISIKATSANLPTGADLVISSIDGDLLTTDTNGAWYAIDFAEYSLEPSTKYAIVIRALGGDADNSLHVLYDGSAATYADGSEINTTNGGVTWAADTDDDLLFQVWGMTCLAIEKGAVVMDYIETGDMLFVLEYVNIYPPYYPSYDPATYFDIQLLDTDGVTLIAQTPMSQWGVRPGAIYLNADTAAALTPGSAYYIGLYGNFGANPDAYYTLTAADWATDLPTWCLLVAHDMEDFYTETSLTVFIAGKGEVLNEEGGAVFALGIPGLSDVHPEVFQVAIHTPGYTAGDEENAWTAETWENMVGPQVAGFLNSTGDIVGTDGRAIGAFILMFGYVGIAGLALWRKLNMTIILLIASPFILAGGWLRLIDMPAIAIVGAIFVIMLALSIFVFRT